MPSSPSYTSYIIRTLPAFVLFYIFCFVAAAILLSPLNGDEHMYIAASQLLKSKNLYTDFAYLQMPYMPYIYHLASLISDNPYILGTARLVKVIITILLLFITYKIFIALSKNRWLAVSCLILLVTNPIILSNFVQTRSYDASMLFLLLGIWAFFSYDKSSQNQLDQWKLFLTGLCISTATGFKLFYAIFPLIFLICIFFSHESPKKIFKNSTLFLFGVGVGILPILYLCLSSGLENAYFNNILYHNINTTWRIETGHTKAMSLISKIKETKFQLLTVPSQFLLLILMVTFIANKTSLIQLKNSQPVILSLTFLMFSIIILIVLTPLWQGYFSLLITATTFLFVSMYTLQQQTKKNIQAIVYSCALLSVVFNSNFYSKRIIHALNPSHWTGTIIHNENQTLTQFINPKYDSKLTATLLPIYALEAGLDIYPELSTGTFAYRVGDLLNEKQRKKFNTTSKNSIYQLLSQQKPTLILAYNNKIYDSFGFDTPFIKFALDRGYKQYNHITSNLVIYARP